MLLPLFSKVFGLERVLVPFDLTIYCHTRGFRPYYDDLVIASLMYLRNMFLFCICIFIFHYLFVGGSFVVVHNKWDIAELGFRILGHSQTWTFAYLDIRRLGASALVPRRFQLVASCMELRLERRVAMNRKPTGSFDVAHRLTNMF